MSFDADLIVDRRRMRRKLTFWRVVAVFVVIRHRPNITRLLAGTENKFGQKKSESPTP